MSLYLLNYDYGSEISHRDCEFIEHPAYKNYIKYKGKWMTIEEFQNRPVKPTIVSKGKHYTQYFLDNDTITWITRELKKIYENDNIQFS